MSKKKNEPQRQRSDGIATCVMLSICHSFNNSCFHYLQDAEGLLCSVFFFIEEQWVVICIYPLWYVVQETVHAILNIREMTGKFSEAEQHCHTPLPFKRLHYGHFHCKYELYFCFISLLVTLSVHSSSDNDLKKIQFKV